MDPFTAFEEYTRRDWDTGAEGTVRFALVGLGWFASDFALPGIEASDYAEVTTAVSRDASKAASFADEHDLTTALDYEGFHEGVDAEAYDAVYIATPNALHLPHIEAAAGLGKDIVCEKPLEATVERAERAVEAASDVTLMTAYRMQLDPAMRRARELIADGYIGEPTQAEGSFSVVQIQSEADKDQWRLDADLAGGGPLYDVGVYPLNTLGFLFDAAPERIQGTLASPDPGYEEVDEHAAFIVEYGNGVQAVCRSSGNSAGGNRMCVEGTEGTIEFENCFSPGETRTIELSRDGHTARYEGLGGEELREQFDYFAHCVLTGTEPAPNGEEGAHDVRALNAVQESDETGERIDL